MPPVIWDGCIHGFDINARKEASDIGAKPGKQNFSFRCSIGAHGDTAPGIAGVPACEFGRRLAARTDGRGADAPPTRSRGWLRYRGGGSARMRP